MRRLGAAVIGFALLTGCLPLHYAIPSHPAPPSPAVDESCRGHLSGEFVDEVSIRDHLNREIPPGTTRADAEKVLEKYEFKKPPEEALASFTALFTKCGPFPYAPYVLTQPAGDVILRVEVRLRGEEGKVREVDVKSSYTLPAALDSDPEWIPHMERYR